MESSSDITIIDSTSTVIYKDRDNANCKVYELGNGITVFVLSQKSLRLLLRQMDSPFDIIIASTSYRFMSEIAEAANSLYLGYADSEISSRSDSFNGELASQVAGYLEAHREAKKIAFTCDAGQSRSPALAAAFIRHLGYEDDCIWENPYFSPNTLVYSVMLEAWGISVTENDRMTLKAKSEQALADMISGAQKRLILHESH